MFKLVYTCSPNSWLAGGTFCSFGRKQASALRLVFKLVPIHIVLLSKRVSVHFTSAWSSIPPKDSVFPSRKVKGGLER